MSFYFLVFIFGTLIGSFLNVVILRYNTGKNIFALEARSICFSCGKKLAWYELVPVFSFLFLRAKCGECKSFRFLGSIRWLNWPQALFFVAVFLKDFSGAADPFSFSPYLAALVFFHLVIWCLLIVITVYDLRHKIIPDGLVYAFIVISLITAAIFPASAGGSFLSSLIAGVAFFAFFGGLWFFSKGRWLGFGDAKLVLGIGFLLGLASGISALTLAFWIGAVVSIFLLALGRLVQLKPFQKAVQNLGLRAALGGLTMKSEIPFAPFIILGALIAFFWHVDMFGLSVFF